MLTQTKQSTTITTNTNTATNTTTITTAAAAAAAEVPPPATNPSTTTTAAADLPPPQANLPITNSAATTTAADLPRRSPDINDFFEADDTLDDLDFETDPIDIAQVAHDFMWEKPADQTLSVASDIQSIQWYWIDGFGERW